MSDSWYQPSNQTAGKAVVIGLTLLGTGGSLDAHSAQTWISHIQPRVRFELDVLEAPDDPATPPDVRTVAEHVQNIREVLNPPVADLAALLEVSRQAIYKWLAGTVTPEASRVDKIIELSRIADAFREVNIRRAGHLLKMKAFDGRSLMDLIRAGEHRNEHVASLVHEARLMEAAYQRSGLATSRAAPNDDWQSHISIPGGSEQG